VDGVTVDTRNPERLAQDAARARRMGFGGKLCIHPAQVQPLHAVFDPDPAAVAHAQRRRHWPRPAAGSAFWTDAWWMRPCSIWRSRRWPPRLGPAAHASQDIVLSDVAGRRGLARFMLLHETGKRHEPGFGMW
jgi:hypothetical protein